MGSKSCLEFKTEFIRITFDRSIFLAFAQFTFHRFSLQGGYHQSVCARPPWLFWYTPDTFSLQGLTLWSAAQRRIKHLVNLKRGNEFKLPKRLALSLLGILVITQTNSRVNFLKTIQRISFENNSPWLRLSACFIGYFLLYNNQINARVLIGLSAVGYCAGKPTEKSRVFWIII